MDGSPIVLARVVHRSEVAARNERDLVTISIVIGGEHTASFLIFLALIVQSQPTDRPGHFAVRTAARERIAPRADSLRSVIGSLVFTDRTGRRDFNLIYADYGDVGKKPAGQGLSRRRYSECLPRKCEGSCGGRGVDQKPPSAGLDDLWFHFPVARFSAIFSSYETKTTNGGNFGTFELAMESAITLKKGSERS